MSVHSPGELDGRVDGGVMVVGELCGVVGGCVW